MSRVNDEMEALTRKNKRIWDETFRRADNWKVTHAKIIESINDEKLNKIIESKKSKKRVVKVLNEDSLDIATILSSKGIVPLIINSGSQNDPMRIIESGASGPEWDLFRRSNICNALITDQMYPLRENRTLYIPDVTIFRSNKYDKLPKPFKVAILTTNPISRPGTIQTQDRGRIVETYQNQSDADRMRNKINRMFEVALIKGHKCLIVDDFGCQREMENPIQEIIKFFNDAIEKYPVPYVFFSIQEPILEKIKHKTDSRHKEYKNYVLFNAKINRHSY